MYIIDTALRNHELFLCNRAELNAKFYTTLIVNPLTPYSFSYKSVLISSFVYDLPFSRKKYKLYSFVRK